MMNNTRELRFPWKAGHGFWRLQGGIGHKASVAVTWFLPKWCSHQCFVWKLANTFQKVWSKPDKEAFLQRLTYCCNQHVRQMFSTSSKPCIFQFHYLLVKSLQVCTGNSASSMQTTGDRDNLPLTKAIVRRFLVSHRIPLCYYLMLAATNNLQQPLISQL